MKHRPKHLFLSFVIPCVSVWTAHGDLLYHFPYETDLTENLGSGAAALVTVGTPTLTADGADGSAQFADFGGGNFANADHQTLDVSADSISLGKFQLSFYLNNQGKAGDYDDFLSIQHDGLADPSSDSIGLLYVRNTNVVNFRGVGGTSTATVNDSLWHQVTVFGETDGSDAVLTFYLDSTLVSSKAIVGGAAYKLTNIWISGRPDGANNRYIDAGLDEVKIWNEVIGPPPPPAAVPAAHYWSINSADEDPVTFAQADLYGSSDLLDGPNGFSILDDTTYGPAFTGADRALITERSSDLYLETLSPNGFQWGATSFAFSYWIYDDGSDNDPGGAIEDLRGPRVFDCLDAETTGIQLGTTATGVFNLRIDDDADGSFSSDLSTEFATLIPPRDQWVHVAVNVDRSTNGLTIFIDGVSQGSADISGLTGNINATQALQVGVINGGGNERNAQAQGLDDLAFYPDLLSQQQITDLVAAATTPLDILISMEPSGPIPIVSVSYDAGEVTLVFTSTSGKTYSVFGGTDLSDTSTWPEVSTSDLVGDGSDLSYSYTPPGSPAVFFLQVRED